MNESPWTRQIVADMRAVNAMVFAVVGSKMQEPGWPDRYVCHTRWTGWLEFKGESTRLSAKQRIIIRELNKRGANAVVVRQPDRIEDHDGRLLATFDGTGRGLLLTLEEMDR